MDCEEKMGVEGIYELERWDGLGHWGRAGKLWLGMQ